jgi:K+-transporting ATPase ATPase C chain
MTFASFSLLRPAACVLALFTVITGVAYPLAATGLAQALWPEQAQGSLIRAGDAIQGSRWIGQAFTQPRYFWGRPSATADAPYNGLASGGSNLGPTNPALTASIRARLAALRAADPGQAAPVPVELVTASASGLDPEISPAAAAYQVARVARARGLSPETVQALVDRHTQRPTRLIGGEPVVNVLALNLALDARAAK